MPIFKMSLGSKELFHSNFLEFLWDTDKKSFIQLLNNLCNESFLQSKEAEKYILSREKENFDLCVYHEEWVGKKGHKLTKPRVKYDLIIENKVKSIPDKSQLDGYQRKIEKHNAKFLLLSLIENFECRNEIENEWKIVNYETLSTEIKKCFGESNQYINDYCKFIHLMHNLQRYIVPTSDEFSSQKLWPEINEYKRHRLHDLYIKQRGLAFMELIKQQLENKSISYSVVTVAGEKLRAEHQRILREQSETPKVYLNWAIYNAEGQIAAFIHRGGNEIYEIVIQGDHYKHGINYVNVVNGKFLPLDNGKAQARSKIWKRVNSSEFITKPRYPLRKQYCGYNNDCIYRYKKISEERWNVNSLLKYMVNDITTLVDKLK